MERERVQERGRGTVLSFCSLFSLQTIFALLKHIKQQLSLSLIALILSLAFEQQKKKLTFNERGRKGQLKKKIRKRNTGEREGCEGWMGEREMRENG